MCTGNKREQQIIRMVQEKMPDAEIGMIEVEKNNDCSKRGIQIRMLGDLKGVVVYWEGINAACGEYSTEEETADYICHIDKEELPVMINADDIRNWEKAKNIVYKKVVNYERNKGRLHTIVHRRYLDLAEVYYVRVRVPGNGWGTAEVSEQLLEEWGIQKEELGKQADANMASDGYCVQPVGKILQDIISVMGGHGSEFYVIHNEKNELGAAAMTRPDLMKNFMEQIGMDCYILPSSIHELLAVPCNEETDAEELQVLVKEVNQTPAVRPEDFLSDSVYYCHMDTGEVELCRVPVTC